MNPRCKRALPLIILGLMLLIMLIGIGHRESLYRAKYEQFDLHLDEAAKSIRFKSNIVLSVGVILCCAFIYYGTDKQ